jgi:hypothetical protein
MSSRRSTDSVSHGVHASQGRLESTDLVKREQFNVQKVRFVQRTDHFATRALSATATPMTFTAYSQRTVDRRPGLLPCDDGLNEDLVSVRVAQAFFDDLDRQLGSERGRTASPVLPRSAIARSL